MHEIHFFAHLARFSLRAAGFFSQRRLRGMQEGCVYTTVQVGTPPGLRGACSWRSHSRQAVFFFLRGALSDAELQRTNSHNPSYSLCCCYITSFLQLPSSLLCGRHGPRYNSSSMPSSSLCGGHGRCFCMCVCAMILQSQYGKEERARNLKSGAISAA